VFQNLWQDLDGNAHRNRVRKQFIDTFAQYEQREKALQAAVIAKQDEITATIDDDIAIYQIQIQRMTFSSHEEFRILKQNTQSG
jgi:hypothetical protein